LNDLDIQYRLLDSFDDNVLSPKLWNDLLSAGGSDIIFMTWEWQSTWWKDFGRGKLLLGVAEKNGNPITIAPLFEDGGMIFFVGSGGSDYLDFIGDNSDDLIIEKLLSLAIEQVSDFVGIRFYHLQDSSPSSVSLMKVAERLDLYICEEGELPSPQLDLKGDPENALQSTRKKSLLRHEAWFNRNGGFEVEHLKDGMKIVPLLDAFFKQHIKRWAQTPYPSLFLDKTQCLFYRQLSETMNTTGWLRFTRIIWKDQVIAYHFGFNYKGSFLWYKPGYEIDMARQSPGEVLLRQLILLALKEEAHTFDFGLGDEDFKKRFATNIPVVKTWGLYPPSSVKQPNE
jgi:CelD/BcsL family acetyltransferase involved in cellulose biosynthesis